MAVGHRTAGCVRAPEFAPQRLWGGQRVSGLSGARWVQCRHQPPPVTEGRPKSRRFCAGRCGGSWGLDWACRQTHDAGLESSWRCDAVDLRLPSCRDGMDGVRRPREMAGGWRPPAERMLPPLQTGSAWLRAETAHEDVFRRAGWQRWLWGHGQARRLSPVPIDTWHACRPCGAIRVGRGAARRGGGWRRVAIRRARRPGRCRRMHSQRFPPRFEGPSHGQYPPSMHMYQARTGNPRPKGFEGCHTRTDRGDGICVGRDGALCKPQHAEVALEGSSPLSMSIRMPPPGHAARVAACQTPRPS